MIISQTEFIYEPIRQSHKILSNRGLLISLVIMLLFLCFVLRLQFFSVSAMKNEIQNTLNEEQGLHSLVKTRNQQMPNCIKSNVLNIEDSSPDHTSQKWNTLDSQQQNSKKPNLQIFYTIKMGQGIKKNLNDGKDAEDYEPNSGLAFYYPVMMFVMRMNIKMPLIAIQSQQYIQHFHHDLDYNMKDGKEWYQLKIFQLLMLFAVSFCLKMVLAPAYFSTDMDVHQNWLRITTVKPLEEWYFDNESKWTLDYPPLFAYFEWMLAKFSRVISPGISSTINQMKLTIYYQRATVMFSEIPYLLVLNWIFGGVTAKMVSAYFFIPLILLDNIHFQYNILMQALLLLSVQLIRRDKFVIGAFTFSVLLNFKHIYLYASLAFFAYILKQYVLKETSIQLRIQKLVRVGLATLVPFILAFLPFILIGGTDQLKQIFSRLFPFQRGLIHQYWAPNFWALYYFLDKVLKLVLSRLGMQMVSVKEISELHTLNMLPNVPPFLTTCIVILVSLPLLLSLLTKKKIRFQSLVFLCGSLFFLFGFHVHEKAITPYICLLMVFLREQEEKSSLMHCAIFVNIINLLPLLLEPNQKLLRILVPILWIAIWQKKRQIESLFQIMIVTVGLGIVLFHEAIHPLFFSKTMQFLPLMLNSLFCAAFNFCWIFYLYWAQLKREDYASIPNSAIDE